MKPSASPQPTQLDEKELRREGVTRVQFAWISVITGVVTFGGFAAYAFLAPTTYVTSATIRLNVDASQQATLPPPREAAERLRSAILNARGMRKVADELGVTTPQARLEQADRIGRGTTITSADSLNFEIVCQGTRAENVRDVCNALAREAARAAPKAVPRRVTPPEETERKKKVEDLLAFLAEHPDSALAKPSESASNAEPGKKKNDALLNTLKSERALAQKQLLDLQTVDPNNPYADELDAELKTARRRLAALDQAIADRNKALVKGANTPAPAKEDAAGGELVTMLKELAETAETKDESAKPAHASVVRAALLPESPVKPNRPLALIAGAVAAFGLALVGIGVALATRRPASSPVPKGPEVRPAAPAEHPAPQEAPQEQPARDLMPSENVNPQAGSIPPAEGPQLAEGSTPAPDEDAPRTLLMPGTAPRVDALSDTAAVTMTVETSGSEVPVTQIGGLGAPPHDASPADASSAKNGAPREPKSNPISVRSVRTVEQPAEKEVDDGRPAERYTPPKRNVTRRLGSPAWVTNVLPDRSSTPASTRYSYVSSRPPPPGKEPPAPGEPKNPGPPKQPERVIIEATAQEVQPSNSPPEQPNVAPPHEPQQYPIVPVSRVERHPAPASWRPGATDFKAYEALCDEVLRNVSGTCLVVGVTGPASLAPDKASMCAEFGLALADRQKARVLLMEGNFQSPRLHQTIRIEMPMGIGFSQQIQRRHIQRAQSPWHLIECLPFLHIIGEGIIRAPGVILSHEFETCVRDMRSHYNVILIDGPPISNQAETRAFAQVLDGVIVCAPKGATDEVAWSRSLFKNTRFFATYELG